jgi:hypothetical protein
LVAALPLLVLAAPINEPKASVESLTAPIDPSDPCATTNCSGAHGTCLAGSCVCHTHWRGANCEEQACPRACSGHGSCLHGTCYCSHGWVGVDCSVPEVRCAHDCSGRGHGCIGGRCLCAQGWAADDCSVPSDECPGAEGCNNHGKCSRGACVCDEGFGGAKCELMLCANDCHHRGYCAAPGRCVCHGGWRGASCEIRSGCAGFMWAHGRWHMCSGHGACNEQLSTVCANATLGGRDSAARRERVGILTLRDLDSAPRPESTSRLSQLFTITNGPVSGLIRAGLFTLICARP